MAEGFEPYHVPQQSRREKLRIFAQNQQTNYVDSSPSNTHNQLQGCIGFSSYDPSSLISSDLLTCAVGTNHGFQHQSSHLLGHTDQGIKGNSVKEEGMSLMGMYGSASSAPQNAYMESHGSVGMIPNSVRDVNDHPSSYFYRLSQNVRQLDHQSFHEGEGGEIMLYRPEALSLSLSSQQQNHQTSHPQELNLQKYVVGELSRSTVPLGPFTGYATILKNSRFLKPGQQLLEDVCDVSSKICYAEKMEPADSSFFDSSGDSLSGAEIGDSSTDDSVGGEYKKFKSRLISMLDEVYRRYKQYHQQLEAVIVSFESVAGLSNAAPFVNLAIKAMSKQFRRLKKAIVDQLQFLGKVPSNTSSRKDGFQLSESGSRPTLCGQRPIHSSGHHPVWRPQRGLPERAVSVLRSWLFDHFLHPYPTDTDKMMLARQTGLTRGQVSNWFINARVRLWKPMVEEIHALETSQGHKAARQQDKGAAGQPNDRVACASSFTSDKLSISCTKNQDPPFKRVRNELPDLPLASDQHMNILPYNNLSGHPCMGVSTAAGGSSGVSLTLGLHQNNGMGLPSEPFPIDLSHRYGFNANSEGCIVGGFDGQTRHLTRDVMGGYLLHDFVG